MFTNNDTIYTREKKYKIMAVNRGPRKNGNAATILRRAAEGALKIDPDLECEQINLYDYNCKGASAATNAKGSAAKVTELARFATS